MRPSGGDRGRDRWSAESDWYARYPLLAGQGSRRAVLIIPVVLSFLAQVPFAAFRAASPAIFGIEPRAAAIALALAVAGPLALTAARRYPGPVVAIVSAAASANLLVTGRETGPPYVALAFAIVGALARRARGWAWISVTAAWVLTLVGGAVLGIQWRPFAVAGTTFGILVVLGIGESLRTRRERSEQRARSVEARRQSEVQAERVRIARELHDVLAHSLSQINVQAGVGLHLMESQPQRAAEALASIKESSKTALDEVRSVLGVLRSETDASAALVPEPDLSRLAALVSSVDSRERPVTLRIDVDGTAPASVQLAVYRIVQEALTNVVRHSGATSAEVSVDGDADRIRVEVRDDGRGAPASGTGGRGLVGMRERAELLGGALEVESGAAGFRVEATIPIPKAAGR